MCFLLLSLCRLFSAASSDSIRFHSNLSSQNDNDLRVSVDNTCTDSLVTALDDEALLLTESFNEMSKSKVVPRVIIMIYRLVRRLFTHTKLICSIPTHRSILTMCPSMGPRRRNHCPTCQWFRRRRRRILSKTNYSHGFSLLIIG